MTENAENESKLTVQKAVTDIIAQLAREVRRERGITTTTQPVRQLSASAHAADLMPEGNVRTLNENELKSVYALLAYVAHNENMQQETVQSLVEANFGVNHVTKLQHKDYDDVIRFLVDLRLDEMKD